MEEGLIHGDLMIVAHQQPAEIAQPGKGAFARPALAVAAQRAAIVE